MSTGRRLDTWSSRRPAALQGEPCWTARPVPRRTACSKLDEHTTNSTASRPASGPRAGRPSPATSGGLAVGVRDFWQNWPKGHRPAGRAGSAVGLCPALRQGPLRRQAAGGGEQAVLRPPRRRVHVQGRRGQDARALGDVLSRPSPTRDGWPRSSRRPKSRSWPCEPAYACATKALGDFPPADPRSIAGYDAWFEQACQAHSKQRDEGRVYGMLNYGDWCGERGVNWGNLEYDLGYGMFLQYLRTGDRRVLPPGRTGGAASHRRRRDPRHEPAEPLGPAAGGRDLGALREPHGRLLRRRPAAGRATPTRWARTRTSATSGSAATSTTTSSPATAAPGTSPSTMADAMARHCPTAYGDHIRGLGWPMVLVLNAYEATGDKKYLDAATPELGGAQEEHRLAARLGRAAGQGPLPAPRRGPATATCPSWKA